VQHPRRLRRRRVVALSVDAAAGALHARTAGGGGGGLLQCRCRVGREEIGECACVCTVYCTGV
jgi:hypothetical protein